MKSKTWWVDASRGFWGMMGCWQTTWIWGGQVGTSCVQPQSKLPNWTWKDHQKERRKTQRPIVERSFCTNNNSTVKVFTNTKFLAQLTKLTLHSKILNPKKFPSQGFFNSQVCVQICCLQPIHIRMKSLAAYLNSNCWSILCIKLFNIVGQNSLLKTCLL